MKYLGGVLLFAATVAWGQTSPVPNAAKLQPFIRIVQQQFGSSFALAQKFPTPVITTDLDGDGVEDLVMVAESKDPLPDSYQYKYVVEDPYHSFFGFGDVRETAAMGRFDPQNHPLLVVFGAGAQAWRAATPKAKFVLINVPFDSIEVGRMLVKPKKPPIFVIKAVEAQEMESSVFWDAKKKRWRWEPGNTID
ncbi:MAG TPA: hypothetical protein VFP59_08110 [Candidatus Angelobacter sp.]|nr:hypothetical protein [Candidatus Angelobacter sp.]